jgi:hypothetical protein
VALLCDGALSNWSEQVMTLYDINHDAFNCSLYTTAFFLSLMVAYARNALLQPMTDLFLLDGTINELETGSFSSGWTAWRKVLLMAAFTTSGLFGASFLAAITKRFGAFSMSMTSSAYKATTLLFIFTVLEGKLTLIHIVGIVLFFVALGLESVKKRAHHRNDGYKLLPTSSSWYSVAKTMRLQKSHGDDKSINTSKSEESLGFQFNHEEMDV